MNVDDAQGGVISVKAAPQPGPVTMVVRIKEGAGEIVQEGVTEVLYERDGPEGPQLNVKKGTVNNIYLFGGIKAFSVVVDGEDAVCWGVDVSHG